MWSSAYMSCIKTISFTGTHVSAIEQNLNNILKYFHTEIFTLEMLVHVDVCDCDSVCILFQHIYQQQSQEHIFN